MAGATDAEVFDHVFGSCFDTWSWWVGYRLNSGAYSEPGWTITVGIEDPDDEWKVLTKNVTADMIRSAAREILDDQSYSQGLRDECAHLLYDADATDLDAARADVLMQHVMFDGQIIYG